MARDPPDDDPLPDDPPEEPDPEQTDRWRDARRSDRRRESRREGDTGERSREGRRPRERRRDSPRDDRRRRRDDTQSDGRRRADPDRGRTRGHDRRAGEGRDPWRDRQEGDFFVGDDAITSLVISVLLVGAGFVVSRILVSLVEPGVTSGLQRSVLMGTVTGREILEVLMILLAVGEIGFAVVALGFLKYKNVPLRTIAYGFPSPRTLGLTAVATVAAVGVNVGVFQLPARAGVSAQFAFDLGWWDAAVLVGPVMFLVVAPAEELLFRGVIQRYLVGPLSRQGALVAASGLFALAHYQNATLTASPGTILLMNFVAGLLLGGLYERTDNLLAPIVLHGAYNTVVISTAIAGSPLAAV